MENVPDVKKAVKQRRCLIGTVDCWLIWVRSDSCQREEQMA